MRVDLSNIKLLVIRGKHKSLVFRTKYTLRNVVLADRSLRSLGLEMKDLWFFERSELN
jgi:hypothetical protein